MLINLSVPLCDLDGQPIKDQKGEEIIFSKQIGNLLFQAQDKDNPLQAYELAKKVYHSSGETDFSTSEVEKIKVKVKEGLVSGFAGQALEIIAKANIAEEAGK